MGFRVFQIADQGAYFVVLIFCALSSVAALILRFVATHRSNRKPGAEDWFALVAVLLFLARIGFMLDCKISHLTDGLSLFKHYKAPCWSVCSVSALLGLVVINGRSIDPMTIDPPSFAKIFKVCITNSFDRVFFLDILLFKLTSAYPQMVLTSTITAMLDQTFAKFSICALYHRIFGVNRVYRHWVYILAAAQCATFLALLCMQLLQCRPLHRFWDWLTPGECMSWTTILLATEPPNSLVDFGLVWLAMLMIRPMQLKPSAKWKLRFLFGLGSL